MAITASNHVNIPEALITGLQELINIIHVNVSSEGTSTTASDFVNCTWGNVGRPRLDIRRDDLEELLHTALPVEHLSWICGVSRSTMNRRLKEHTLSVRACYSNISDEELDHVVRSIKIRMPHAGYRLMKGELLARGHRIQWHRMKASMRRVDGAGILARMVQLGFIARRSYSVPAPLSLVHVDTNHKLITSYTLMLLKTTRHQLPSHSFWRVFTNMGGLQEYVVTRELKTWTLHVACSQYEELVEVASLPEKAFTIKGAKSGLFLMGPKQSLA